MTKKNVRLSKNIIPVEYDLQLKPDLHNFTFQGIEAITLRITEPTRLFTLHSKEIDIRIADIGEKDEKIFASKISYNEKAETVTFNFPKVIKPGKIKLNIVFSGILNDKMRGFYRSQYLIDGKTHHMATTQFEATDARKAFPCFDEPAQKAVFHVSLIIPKDKTAISNTLPIGVREHEVGFDIVRFAPTPKMSTYLLAFMVGDFEYIEKKSKRGVIVRVYTTPGKKHQATFALDITVRVLDFYEGYFDIPYPLNTLDMIAIPDFSSLAMENWGAITFREIGLLVDEKNTSTASKELIAEVIAHELAHQWFGNLVTMEWWTHLWLNEGFASYIPYLVIENLFPEWNIWERFTNDTQGIALRLDALKSTHPIEVEVHHPDEIGEIFDAVSYSKGASVIRMLADYLGEKDFRDGLRYYLKKHSYKNTETIHLWQAFQKISNKPVAKMMHTWTSRNGYPVINAEIKNNKLSLSQERFFSSPISKKKAKDTTLWQIPLLLSKNTVLFGTKNLYLPKPKNWLKLNQGESGFFRTAYSPELLEALRPPVRNMILPSWDRLGIIRDLFALSEAGVISTTDTLQFLTAYKNEDNLTVWTEIALGITKLQRILVGTKAHQKLNGLVIELLSPLHKRLSWNKVKDEPYNDALLRPIVISLLGEAGDEQILSEAKKLFLDHTKGSHVDPDIRGCVYRLTASQGGMSEFKTLIKKYITEHLHEEKNRIGGALGSFSDPKILKLVCEFALSRDVRTQDAIGITHGVGQNANGRDVWFAFITKNWKTLVSRYGEGGMNLSRAVAAISGSAEEKHLKKYSDFFKTHEAPGAKRAVEQVIERLEGNIAWLKRDLDNILGFFNN